jgi:hypothetical protein
VHRSFAPSALLSSTVLQQVRNTNFVCAASVKANSTAQQTQLLGYLLLHGQFSRLVSVNVLSKKPLHLYDEVAFSVNY